MKQNTKP